MPIFSDRPGLFQHLEMMLDAARALTEPTQANAEYIRGQAELISDTSGLGLGEEHYGLLTNIISHRVTLNRGLAALADELRDGER